MVNNEYRERRERLGAELGERKLDALVVSFGPNLRYLSGFTGSNAMLLVSAGGAQLFTDPRYQIQAAQQTTCPVAVCTGPLLAGVAAVLRRRRCRRIGFEQSRTTYEAFQSLRAQLPPKASLEPVTGWIEQHRMVKSAEEIARIRRSVETNSKAFAQTVRHVRAGMREQDLAAELEFRMRRLGAEKPAFETIVAAGARSALPHAQPTAAPFAANNLVVVDMGAFQDGYASDMTRMLFLGRPSAKVKRVYRAVLEAQLAAIDAVRDGVPAADVDRRARRVLQSHRLDRAFVHSTGHGLGLEIHESPRLGKTEKTRLRTAMAITIEPGVYLEGFGGIRIEDTVVVTRSGCDILTPTSKELLLF